MVAGAPAGQARCMTLTSVPKDQAVLMTKASHDAALAALERLRAEQAASVPAGGAFPDPATASAERTDQIVLLEIALARAVVAHPGAGGLSLAAVGTTVDVDDGRRRCAYRIVLAVEETDDDPARPVSAFSPVGAALMGHGVGETVTVALPDGRSRALELRRIRVDG